MADSGGSSQHINAVKFQFRSPDGGDIEWKVRRMEFQETLSDPYDLVLTLATRELHADTDQLLGAQAELTMDRPFDAGSGEQPGVAREVYGIIHQVEYLGFYLNFLVVRVHVCPAFWMLSQQIESRIFQEETVVDILKKVLDEGLDPYGRSVRIEAKPGPKRDFCVQYRESTLDFACRLMEEEGIAYYFDHSGEVEELVLVDNNNAYPEVQTIDGAAIPVGDASDGTGEIETIDKFDWCLGLRTTAVVQRDFDHMQPNLWDPADNRYLTRPEIKTDERGRERQEYAHTERRWIVDDGMDQAALKREAHDVGTKIGRGLGNVSDFGAGRTFELTEHARDDVEKKYLLTRVVHTAECPEVLRQTGESGYENEFECIPLEQPYRPPRITPKPKIFGPQTGTVTGPAGEEIHVDDQGRIKVLMHWDRENPKDESASCWVRVSQPWAGLGWGTFYIPRIDMEVVVEFLEGNPDRPIVTGTVYNALNTPPYPLPAEKTKSTMKSNSSVGGGGFNEIRFEDKAGFEEIFTHAQKDQNETILNNHSTDVGVNQTNTVGQDQTETVGQNQTVTVGKESGSRTVTIAENDSLTVGKDQSITIAGAQTMTVGEGGCKQTVGGTIEKTVVGAVKETYKDRFDLTANKGSINIGSGGGDEADFEFGVDGTHKHTSKVEHFLIRDRIEMDQGNGEVVFKLEGGNLEAEAGKKIHLRNAKGSVEISPDGKVTMESPTEITLKVGKCAITMKEGVVEVDAPVQVKLQGGQGLVQLSAEGANIQGPTVKSIAQSLNVVQGLLVKIN